MKEKKRMNKSALAVSLSLFLVLFLLIGTFVLSQMQLHQDGIVLPNGSTDNDIAPTPEDLMLNSFLQVKPDNVVAVLETLPQERYYHQRFEISVGTHHPRASRHVEIWSNGPFLRAECKETGGEHVKSILMDGKVAWIWYDDDMVPVSVEMHYTSAEDLLGLPQFDYLAHIRQKKLAKGSYEVFEDTLQQCIFVETASEQEITEQFWIDVKTGLLQKSVILNGEDPAYVLTSVTMEVLAQGDTSFEGRFCLPDGTDPFME